MSEPDEVIDDALQRLRMEAARVHRYQLTEGQEAKLANRLKHGLDRWSAEKRDEVSFSQVVNELVKRFTMQLPYNPSMETKSFPPAPVPELQQGAFEAAFNSICPLWPFC